MEPDQAADFVACPPEGGIVKLPPGNWVTVRSGWKRLWGDGVHDDTEAVQAWYDRYRTNPPPPEVAYRITSTITVPPFSNEDS